MRKTNDNEILEMLKKGKSQKAIAEYFNVSPVAIHKRIKRLLPPPPSLGNLTEKEAKFAIGVSGGKTATQSVMDSHDVISRESAKSMGSQLMKKPEVAMAINELMEFHGMGRSYRVGRLKNHVDHVDPNVSLKALDQSWKLEGLYLDKHVNINVNYSDLVDDLDSTNREIEKLEKEIIDVSSEPVVKDNAERQDNETEKKHEAH